MRKTPLLLTTLLAAFASIASAQKIYTTVDGSMVVYSDVEPMMMNSRVMVPLRGVFEHMGAFVQWDPSNREVRVSDEGTLVTLRIGESSARVNGSLVALDAPATIVRGRTMVPLRFISESFGHEVYWNAPIRTVEITTVAAGVNPPPGSMVIRADTVIPWVLQTTLASSTSRIGDRFTATLDTNGMSTYEGLPTGTVLEGHVGTVRPKTSSAPGVIGLEFDRIRLPNGNTYVLYGDLIALNNDSIIRESDGTLRARNDAPDDLMYVGYGAAAGILVALVTDGNILTDAVIGAALGYLFGRTQVDANKYNNVTLRPGAEFGVALSRDLQFRWTP